ncbi:LysR substrate-binding domain-containing protein [Rhodopila sp.]|uniref:LysR substrate-binding domain-containing protein n=1 Tax=Rhodopila sp. TaxID=2480087 RepID=UPI002D1B727E|nr:LysR substrate-binding domain-containing protein [Rhodopila sp.]HVZ07449.1 LysR substrate-binding domain-containing protein [Rhodopila sp.]
MPPAHRNGPSTWHGSLATWRGSLATWRGSLAGAAGDGFWPGQRGDATEKAARDHEVLSIAAPSLRALKAFAETVRAGSLTGAAAVLHITPSAVSHLLRQLEDTLGVTLFAERAPRIRLTEGGETLGRRLAAAFDTIDGAIAEVRHRASDIRVSTLSSFLSLWLLPRFGRFQARHPNTRLLFSTGMRPVDLATEPFECAIRWGTGGWAGLDCTLLFRDRPVLVANPRLLDSIATVPRLAAGSRPEDWPLVAAALGLPDTPPALTFETRAQAVQAAVAGMGAAVVDRNLVTGLLADGLLAELAPEPPVLAPQGHWFVCPPNRLRIPQVRALRDWLVSEASVLPVQARPAIG